MGWVIGDMMGVPRTSIERVDRVIAEFHRRVGNAELYTLRGLIKVATLIHNETLRGDVHTPIDLGNLRHSWFVVTSRGGLHAGKSVSSFSGPKAAEYAAGHSALVAEMKQRTEHLQAQYNGPFVIIGYSANYAMYVHEMLGANFNQGKRKDPRGGPRWFSTAIAKQMDEMINILTTEARKGITT